MNQVTRREAKWMIILAMTLALALLAGRSHAEIDPKTVVGMWLFDDDATDASGNGNDGEIKGNLKFSDDAIFGKSLSFPKQAGSFVLVPHNDAFHVTELSLVVWAKLETPGARQVIVSNRKQGETTRSFQIKIENGQVVPEFNFTSGKDWQGTDNIRAATDITNGEWYHIAATYDGDTMRIYVNGVMERESVRGEEPDRPGAPLAIGGQFESGSHPFSGTLDEVALFNVALDEEDILAIKDRGLEEAVGIAAVSPSGKIAATWSEIKK